jgi:hypothetical protein
MWTLIRLYNLDGAGVASSQNNWRTGRIFCCLLFFLGLAIAAREAPETASLTDDTSNDSIAVSCVQEAVPRPSSQRSIPQEKHFYRATLIFRNVTGASVAAQAPLAVGQRLLRLLCVQRKQDGFFRTPLCHKQVA